MKKNELLTQQQFDELWPKLKRLSASSVEVARLVLVEGVAQKEAGDLHGVSKQNVSRVIKVVRKILAEAPPGWVHVDTYAPQDMAEEFLDAIKRIKEGK